jgi:hypothetical protein
MIATTTITNAVTVERSSLRAVGEFSRDGAEDTLDVARFPPRCVNAVNRQSPARAGTTPRDHEEGGE